MRRTNLNDQYKNRHQWCKIWKMDNRYRSLASDLSKLKILIEIKMVAVV